MDVIDRVPGSAPVRHTCAGDGGSSDSAAGPGHGSEHGEDDPAISSLDLDVLVVNAGSPSPARQHPRRRRPPRSRSASSATPRKREPLADALADRGRALADAGGEDERVEPAERGGHRGHGCGDAVDVDREREPRPLVAGGSAPRARARRPSRPESPCSPDSCSSAWSSSSASSAVLAQQVEERARVDRARAGGHRHALERAEAHRRVDRAAVAHGRDRAAAAEVADDEARHAARCSAAHCTERPWKP